MKKSPSRIVKIVKRTAIVLLVFVLAVFSFLLYLSPGKTSPIVDAGGKVIPNSIAVIEKPTIGGIEQALIIRGQNMNNPVLLFVHGGPGISTFPFIKDAFKGMEKLFTICYWEQRGAGKSYSRNISPESMTLDQLVQDGTDVTQYLMQKFHKQKIYILGHSWGTFLGSFMIYKHPELYNAYIGIGQVGNNRLSEQRSYAFTVSEARRRNDQNALELLLQLKMPAPNASDPEWYNYIMPERKCVFKFGGARYGVNRKISDLAKPLIFCREYTISDKINYQAGVTFSFVNLWKYMQVNDDLNTILPEQQIPVYIFQGIHDHQTDFAVAKDYFDHLKAPVKRFYAFEHSAHSPHVEEYDAFEKIIRRDVLGIK